MNDMPPRLRMFAGPNGSGKSTLKTVLRPSLVGVYLNPDEIELQLRQTQSWDFGAIGLTVDPHETESFFKSSPLLMAKGLGESFGEINCRENRLDFSKVRLSAYVASVLVEFLRETLIKARRSFTFETVMSHRSKIETLADAKRNGFHTYLYYVATDDPSINLSRVENRVRLGGHDVPSDKIQERYYRSLNLLIDAIKETNRAYIFDNSGDSEDHEHTWLAEITDGRDIEIKAATVPSWFQRYVLDKAQETD